MDYNFKSGYLNYEVSEVTAIPLDGKIFLSWVEPKNECYRKTLLYVGVVDEKNKDLSLYTDPVSPSGTYVTHLRNGVKYDIMLVAKDCWGHESIGYHLTLTPQLKYSQPPVSDFSKKIGRSEIILSWHCPGNPDFFGVEIVTTDSKGNNVDRLVMPCEKGKPASISIGSLQNGYNYNFFIRAQDIWGNFSSVATLEGNPDGMPPSKPEILFTESANGDPHYHLITPSNGDPYTVYRLQTGDADVAVGQRAVLYWRIPKEEDLKEIEVWVGIEGLSRSFFTAVPAAAAEDTGSPYYWEKAGKEPDYAYYRCEIPNLTNGVRYRMSLVALDYPGNGNFVQALTPMVTQDGVPLTPPSEDSVKLTPASNQLKLSWKRPMEGDFAKTVITYYHKASGADSATVLNTLKPNQTRVTLTNLLNEEVYVVQFDFWDSSDHCTTVVREVSPTADAVPGVLELGVAKRDCELEVYWEEPDLTEANLSSPLYAVYCAEEAEDIPDKLSALVDYGGGSNSALYDTGDTLRSGFSGRLMWTPLSTPNVKISGLENAKRYKVVVFLAGKNSKGVTASLGESVIGIPDMLPGANPKLPPVAVPFSIGSEGAPAEIAQIALSYLPVGFFKMGIPFFADSPHWVSFKKGFWMGQHEISYGIWKTVYDWAVSPDRGAGVYTFKYQGMVNNGQVGFSGPSINTDGQLNAKVASQVDAEFYNLPVSGIAWQDAMVWCNALTEYVNAATPSNVPDLKCVYVHSDAAETPLRNANDWDAFYYLDLNIRKPEYHLESKDGYALPTEAQWEYAAKYLQAPNGVTYFMPGTKVSGDYDLYLELSRSGIDSMSQKFINSKLPDQEVRMRSVYDKLPNAVGCYNMNGNIAEWCYDWYGEYAPDSVEDPLGAVRQAGSLYADHKTARGGSCFESLQTLGTGFRGRYKMDKPDFRVGLRVCRNNVKTE